MQLDKDKQRWQEFFSCWTQSIEKISKNVKVLPVSKKQSLEKIKKYLEFEYFPNCLGENFYDELVIKKNALDKSSLEWHFLGRLQSRKIPLIFQNCDYVHGVYREKELRIISQLKADKQLAKFFLQVNISKEPSKGGVGVKEVPRFIELISSLGLEKNLVGFMAMASQESELVVRSQFVEMNSLRNNLFPKGLLSMGMSSDYKIAIEEGADVVRIGSLIFGDR